MKSKKVFKMACFSSTALLLGASIILLFNFIVQIKIFMDQKVLFFWKMMALEMRFSTWCLCYNNNNNTYHL